MPCTTPVARCKTAAMSRVIDCVPRGYCRYTCGVVKATKAEALARKFHTLYGIGCTPGQRLARKAKGKANAILVLYWPEDAAEVHWLLLATEGEGLEQESLLPVEKKPRLKWLGYELVRHAARGQSVWTWRRPKDEMSALFALVCEQAARRQFAALKETLARIARQPGFHGVRQQSWSLFQEARQRGYAEPLPDLLYVQKVSHGERMRVD